MTKTIIILLSLAALPGCGGGMSQAYSALPNTFDDLAQKTKTFRHHDARDKEPRGGKPRTGDR